MNAHRAWFWVCQYCIWAYDSRLSVDSRIAWQK